MARNKVIKPRDVEAIINLIRGWPDETVSWEGVCQACEPVLQYVPTRQGLSAHQAIQDAFKARKAGLKVTAPAKMPLPSSLAVAGQRISYLNATAAELRLKNDRLSEQLMVWLYNARARGLTIEQLNAPLPRIDRERSTT